MVMAQERNISGWLKEPEDPKDYKLFRVHPELVGAAVSLKGIADLRSSPFMPPIGNQLNIGSCGPWMGVANFRWALRKAGLIDFDGSELFEYVNARQLGGLPITQDTGTYIRDCFKALAQFGNAPEEDWPYDTSKFTQVPPQKAYDDALKHQAIRYISVPNNDDAIDAVLDAGFPIGFGIPLYQNWPIGNGVFTIPDPQGQVIGGHAMNFVGYDRARQKRIVRNQWGEAWGDHGYCEVSYAYSRQASDMWYFETVEGDPNVPPPPPPPPPAKVIDGIGIWTINQRTGEIGTSTLWVPGDPDVQVGGLGVHYSDQTSEERWPKP